jgi:chemotaxis protein histidine kinase CheA
MTNVDLSSYKPLFFQTSRAHLDTIKKIIRQPLTPELKYEIFRAAHSLKSQCFAMNYIKLAQLCKTMEAVFALIKEDKLVFSPELKSGLENTITELSASIQKIENNQEENDITKSIEALQIFIPKTT